jgi:phosphonoacetaldehyde hydrolase
MAAGCVTVGVTMSGNDAGLTLEQFTSLSKADRASIRARVGAKLKAAGADHVIDTIADLPALLDEIERGTAL